MNVCGASSAHLAQLLKQNEENLRAAQCRTGELVQERDSPARMIEAHRRMDLAHKMQAMSFTHHMKTTMIPKQYPPSFQPLGSLDNIAITNLQMETHHLGKVLVGKLIVDPIRFVGNASLIEDEAGTVERVVIYNQGFNLDPKAVLSRNSIVAIKEPYFKLAADGGYNIRVDHLSDVILLSKNDSVIPAKFRLTLDGDAGKLKILGNDAVAVKDWLRAEKWYSDGLRCCPSDPDLAKALHLNRALARPHLERHDSAIDDANDALTFDSTNFKALYRKGLALYKLGRFHEARSVVDVLCKEHLGDPEANHLMERNESRMLECKNGIYNFAALTKSVSRGFPRLDIATFCHPVMIKQTAQSGRGLFARHAVRKGQLLMVEKALHVSYKEDENNGAHMLLDFNTRRGFIGTSAVLLDHLVQKCFRNPSQHAAVLDLYSGDYPSSFKEGSFIDGIQTTDTFHIARIQELNAFGCPLLSSKQFENIKRRTPRLDHAERARNEHKSSGIWTTASLMNHACVPNAHRSFIGDAMILRATREIIEGEEITIDYVNAVMLSVQERKKKMKTWGFECQCELCIAEVHIPGQLLKERAALMKDLKSLFSTPSLRHGNTTDALHKLKKLEETYPRTIIGKLPRIELLDPYLALSYIMLQRSDFSAAAALALSAIEALGFAVSNVEENIDVDRRYAIMQDCSVDAFVQLAIAKQAMGNRLAAQLFWEEAALCYQIVVGERDTFKPKYKEEWEKMAENESRIAT